MEHKQDFWIGVGDIHGEIANLERIPELEQAQGVIVSGDLTTRGGVAEARRVMEAFEARNPRLLAQIGNMDTPEIDAYLEGQGWNIHARTVELAPAEDGLPSIGILGVGASTPTPFGTPSEVPDSRIASWLEQAVAQARSFDLLVLVAHDPPYDTKADMLPDGRHVGSRAVREFIEREQPALCLTGHIHESRASDRIGNTVVVNPGPLFGGGYAVIRRSGTGLEMEMRRA